MENPFNLHVKWTAKNNTKSKFLFKRTDESWPPKPAAAPVSTETASTLESPIEDASPVEEPSYESPPSSYTSSEETVPGSSRGYGFGVTSDQLARATQIQRPAAVAKEQTRIGLLGWLNECLTPAGVNVTNLTTDMSDGVVLFRLLELITHKTLKGWHTVPNNMMLKLDNLNMFLRILGYFGIKISGVSPEDIYSGNENIITAILLLMIKKYTPAIKLDQFSSNAAAAQSEAPSDPSTLPRGNLNKSPSEEEFTPPSDEAPLPPPGERPLSSKLAHVDSSADPSGMSPQPRPPSGTDGPLRGRVRSRMVTPDEQVQLAASAASAALIARAPAKFAVDPNLTPDIASLLGPPVEMPLSSGSNSTPPSSIRTPTNPSNVARTGTPPPSGSLANAPKTGSPGPGARHLPAPSAQPGPPKNSGALKMPPKSSMPPFGLASSPSSSPPPGMIKTTQPHIQGSPSSPNAAKRTAVPPKTAPSPTPYSVGHKAPVKYANPKIPPGVRSPMASRPLPVPVAKNEPREEMDITFVPQGAVQDAGIPALEMDFSSPVPGSETAAKAHPSSRTRASTISNINTNIFDLDAFSDMEDLLIGLADNI